MKSICFNPAVSPFESRSLDLLRIAGHYGNAALPDSSLKEKTAAKIAAFFGCPDAAAVTFTRSGSEAVERALRAVMRYGDHAVTTVMEHPAVYSSLYSLTEEAAALYQEYYFRTKSGSRPVTGFTAAGRSPSGTLNVEEMLQAIIKKRPRVVITGGGSTVSGDRFELARISQAARRCDAIVIFDAAYTGGLYPVHMLNDGIDILCFSGHKNFYGPDGIGGIICRTGLPPEIAGRFERAPASGRGQEDGFPDPVSLRALEASVDYIRLAGESHIRSRVFSMARRFYDGIRDLSSIRIIGDFEAYDRFPIVSFLPLRMTAGRFVNLLKKEWAIEAGAVREAVSENLKEEEPSYVRFAFTVPRTEADTDLAIKAVRILSEST